MSTYTLTEEEWNACYEFCCTISTRYYSQRGQDNEKKRFLDNLNGKVGEFAADRILGTNGPDLAIYNVSHKSFAPDLRHNDGREIEIKTRTMESARRWGYSWTFEKKSAFVKSPEDNWFAGLVVLGDDHATGFLCNPELFAAQSLVGHYAPPEQARLTSKTCLYKNVLQNAGFAFAPTTDEFSNITPVTVTTPSFAPMQFSI
ncbi:MAG: hypothetical protein ACOH5I_26580 [Oligoflexus sp.]